MCAIEDLVKYGKLLHAKGLVIGSGGNISVREKNSIIIKRKYADMSRGRSDDYIKVRPEPGNVEKKKDEVSTEYPFHAAIYSERSDVNAVMHTHSPYAVAAAKKTARLEDISYEFTCIMKNPVPVIDYIKPGSCDLAKRVADSIRTGANGIILKEHGPVAVGTTLEEAYLRVLAIERASIVYTHGYV